MAVRETIPVRGRVYRCELKHIEGLKPYLAVSNNRRNQQLPTFLGVRLTTSNKLELPSIVVFEHPEVFVGRALCDDIVELYRDEIREDVGALSPHAMMQVSAALKHALAITNG